LPVAQFACAFLLAHTLTSGDSVRRYGASTPGSGNIAPTIWVNTTPRPGDTNFKLRVERSLGSTWALAYVSSRPANYVYGGVRFLVDTNTGTYGGAFYMQGQGNGGGAGDITMRLPNNREIIGQPVFFQVFTLDDFAPNPLGLGATTGLRILPAMPAQLVVARSLNGSPDPQTAVDLVANTVVDYDRTQFDEASGVTFAQGGAAAMQLDPTTARLRSYDTTTFPPVWRSNAALGTEGYPEFIALNPEGSRAYVVYTGPLGTSPPIIAHDATAGPSFGQVTPGPQIRLERIADARGMAFTPDSRTAFVAALGPRSGSAGSLTRIDTRLGSASFHQATGQIDFPDRLATDVAVAADGSAAYVSLASASGQSEIAVVDVATFSLVDMDQGTPGVQNLGGELSRPRTPLPSILSRVLADPRGEELLCATVGGVVRVNVAADSPFFRRVTLINGNIAPNQLVTTLALTDGADRLYVATAVHVVEYDTRLLSVLRSWAIGGTTALTLR
jgi:hypothetical protein